MKCRWKGLYDNVEGASNFHNKVKQLLRDDPVLKNMKCYQEVPVIDLVETYPNSLHRVDWYIHDLRMILELHGRQHYVMTNFGNVSVKEARENFMEGQFRDSLKREALVQAGYEFREVSYRLAKKLDNIKLRDIIFSGGNA